MFSMDELAMEMKNYLKTSSTVNAMKTFLDYQHSAQVLRSAQSVAWLIM